MKKALYLLVLITILGMSLVSSAFADDEEFWAQKNDIPVYIITDDTGSEIVYDMPVTSRDNGRIITYWDDETNSNQIMVCGGQSVVINYGKTSITAISQQESVVRLLDRVEIPHTITSMIIIDTTKANLSISIDDEALLADNVITESRFVCPNYLMEKGLCYLTGAKMENIITNFYEESCEGERRDPVSEGYATKTIVDYVNDVVPVIEYGCLVHHMKQDVRAVDIKSFKDKKGGVLIFENGDSMIYTDKVINNSTAYYGGPITASGHKVGTGVIAVDPKVYELGTSMYVGSIDGENYYGLATAYDTGGAVKGHIIDLWFPAYKDCVKWERRNVVCYILQDKEVWDFASEI